MPEERDPKIEAAVLLSLAVAKCITVGLNSKVITAVVRETLRKNNAK